MLNKKISYDEKVAKLSLESMLLFTWIIPHLDVKGRFFANSEIIKGQVCPYVDKLSVKKIDKCLLEIQKNDLILIYGNSHKYIEYKGFSKNQTITESRESPSEIPNPTQDELMSDVRVTQGEVKLSKDKVKLSKDKGEIEFDIFWDAYEKKVGKKDKLIKKWDKLSEEQKIKILSHIELYKKATPNKQYRKNPETYLNNESWNDEIIESKNNNINPKKEFEKNSGGEFEIIQ
jgi:hypothetical protein